MADENQTNEQPLVKPGKPPRDWHGVRIAILMGGGLVIAAGAAALITHDAQKPKKTIPAAAPVPNTGGQRLIGGRGYSNKVYRKKAEKYEKRQEKKRSSYVPTPTGLFHAQPKAQSPSTAQAVAQVQRGLPQQPGRRAPMPGAQELGQLVVAWQRPGGVIEQSLGIIPHRRRRKGKSRVLRKAESVQSGGTHSSTAQKAGSQATSAAAASTAPRPLILAGHILYGVTITAVNSRVNGPVVCRMVSAPFRGDNLIGKFQDTNDRLVLTFSQLVHHGRSIPVDVIAVSPNTGTTFLHGNVDHHYFERFGLLAGAAYLEGYGQAFQNAGTTTVTGSGLAVQSSSASQYATQAALGTMGQTMAQSLSNNANIPATVSLPSGAGMGLLFMKPVMRGAA